MSTQRQGGGGEARGIELKSGAEGAEVEVAGLWSCFEGRMGSV